MHCTFIALILPLALLATQVLADGAAIIAAISTVSNATLALNKTVTNFPSNPFDDLFDIPSLLVDSATLLADINDGTKVAGASANLTLTETISLVSATISLASVVESTLKTIVAAKPKFDALLIVSPVLLVNLLLEQKATDAFGT
jgi:hypothetical protein